MSDTDSELVVYAKRFSWIAAVIIVALLTFQYFRTSKSEGSPVEIVTNSADEADAAMPPSPVVLTTDPVVAEPVRQDRDHDGVFDDEDECPEAPEFTHKHQYFADTDGDGRGDPAESTLACAQPQGFIDNGDDLCPRNARKIVPGTCGCDCDFDDVDINENGTPDCLEVEGADGIVNRAKPGWTPNQEGWDSLKELRGDLDEINRALRSINQRLNTSGQGSSSSAELASFEAKLTPALVQLDELGARLYQLQKLQFTRSKDDANRLSAKGFVKSFWKVIVVDQVPDAAVKATWKSIVQSLIELNGAIAARRAAFDAAAEREPERGSGTKRERPQVRAHREIDAAFDRAEKQIKTSSKVLMDIDDLKRELKALSERDT